jgi:hypothetical protein
VNNQELDPAVEVVHLRRLLDIQPGCLLRVGADGMVLAANDAALMLLGERSPAEALGRDFTLWIPRDHHDRWRAFAAGVVHGSPSSIECEIAVPSGARYPTVFHGVPLADHPDGVASMAVAARVISNQRQLEGGIGELREQLHERGDEIRARDEALETAEAARRAAEANCARALADVRQLEMALNEFAKRQEQGIAERNAAELDRLTARLEEREASVQALETAHAAVQAEFEQAHGDRARLEAALEQAQQALAKSEQRAQEIGTERDALQHRLEHAVVAATLEHDRIVSELREHAMRLEALANGIPLTGAGAVTADASAASRAGGEERQT